MRLRALAAAAAMLAAAGVLGPAVLAAGKGEHPEIAARRAKERTNFSDAEIADGFFKVAFGAEMGLAGRTDRIRKYDGPVRIVIETKVKPDRRAALARVVADIRSRVAHLDIAITDDEDEANFTIRLVRNRDLARTVRKLYGAKAKQIVRSLEPQCLSGFRKDETFRIIRSDVLLVADVDDFTFFDCAYEEILQGLGPIRDDESVPWTMFNDDVQMGFFDRYDQYLLNILYDPRVKPGMTAGEVRALLPQIMPTVREFVTKANGGE